MTLLELPTNQQARITRMDIDACYLERLHAVGICESGVVTKTHESGYGQPILVRTDTHNVFAISKNLAKDVTVEMDPRFRGEVGESLSEAGESLGETGDKREGIGIDAPAKTGVHSLQGASNE